ncbi:HK97 family phage prohead protease [Temperatibacter marinus]|uniref:HK97 family phage prohead protease n=1 Tax=Temperatibacter marinus TaxID=1456591 RepID=A0AA52H9X7_9PROT|nr:HK97 family phage prohead protease [Temperatibacter marinus]WND02048.1 HK97 family phage prohead protease [Temperatibacter marinus]
MTKREMISPLEVKFCSDEGSFVGYGSLFNQLDRDGDTIEKGCFLQSLSKRHPAFLWQHCHREPIGIFTSIEEDARGLLVKGKLCLTGRGKEAYDLLKLGALNGLSIGFRARETSKNTKTGHRIIHKADLLEISLVTFPALEEARIHHVKTAHVEQGINYQSLISHIETRTKSLSHQ